MFEALKCVPRLLMQVDLKPVQGDRFQPTGFADLGAAVYDRPDGKRMLLVESAQSVANRLEHACLDGDGPRLAQEFDGLPYVLVKLTGKVETETSSLVEAHRINSPFIITDKEFQEEFKRRAAYAKGLPLDWKKIGAALLYFDPNSLLHGAFMANLEDGRIKAPRAITGFIEAEDVREAASGGVKNNPLDPSGKIRAVNYDKDVYGNVPYHRMEYTAARITAFFNLDLALLVGYGLPSAACELLIALGLYKVRRFLSYGLRLRTACDLEPCGDLQVTRPVDDFAVPSEPDLLTAIKKGIAQCREQGLFHAPPVTELTTTVVLKEKPGQEAAAEGTEAEMTNDAAEE
jgi:CRISPR-associated protein Csb1